MLSMAESQNPTILAILWRCNSGLWQKNLLYWPIFTVTERPKSATDRRYGWNLNVAEDDSGKDANEDSGDLVSGLYCKIVVQFEKYKDFHDALRVLCGRSLQKQGSRLKADYEVTWDKDEFFRNPRNQSHEKNNMAADHYRSEAPRRQVYNSRHSPDKVRPRRFRE
ncbi:hypothetical protein L195_g009653 [Trifolium pratense]|uniref:Uncharacterized protein n=1 Tax=Trifolium pratense TaxID=57577 RepID=A0A2K3PCI7_TRIPR|nr:hypothetical protein L195_g009653 [Trifolium pratense]